MEYVIGSQVVLFAVIVLMYVKLCMVSNKTNSAKKQIDDTDDTIFWNDSNMIDRVFSLEQKVQELKEEKEVLHAICTKLDNHIQDLYTNTSIIEDQINETDDFLFADDGFVNKMEELSEAFDDTEEILFNPEHGIDVRLDEHANCLEYHCQKIDKIEKQLKKEKKNAKKADEKDNQEIKTGTPKRK